MKITTSRILYLSYDGMTDPLGQSQVLPYLTGLGKRGYQFTLISFEKEERLANGRTAIAAICNQHGIDWHPLLYTKRPPVLSTLKDLRRLKLEIKKLQTAKPFDGVHCRSYITALAGQWMKKKWGVKFIFDMRGFWADERTDGGLWNLKNPLFRSVYRYFKKKEKEFLIQADHTISLTENAKNEIYSWEEKQSFSPIAVIPCCADLDLFNPSSIKQEDVLQLRKELNIEPHQKVISYIGSIGTWYMLPEMLDFFKVFLQENRDAIFLFITKEGQGEINKALEEKMIPSSTIRIRAGERSEMPLLIQLADYSLFFIRPSFSKKASSPTKQGEIMAMGIPVICNDQVGDTSLVVEEYHSGVVVEEFSEKAYRQALRQLASTQFDKAAIRKGALEFYALQNGIEKYQSVYKKIGL
ncbi:MAG: glycosyltransferase family 4 protein [Flavisolibacter sp.]